MRNNPLWQLESPLWKSSTKFQEFQALWESLESNQEQIISLNTEKQTLKTYIKNLTDEVSKIYSEDKTMRETTLDLQAHSMRDNLVFSGIPEQPEEDPEKTHSSLSVNSWNC